MLHYRHKKMNSGSFIQYFLAVPLLFSPFDVSLHFLILHSHFTSIIYFLSSLSLNSLSPISHSTFSLCCYLLLSLSISTLNISLEFISSLSPFYSLTTSHSTCSHNLLSPLHSNFSLQFRSQVSLSNSLCFFVVLSISSFSFIISLYFLLYFLHLFLQSTSRLLF